MPGPQGNLNVQATTNYMVPSSGNTHAVPVAGVFAATPFVVDWRQFAVDDFSFQPQGVYIDNTQGVGTVTVTINPIGWNVVCPAGAQVAQSFPAPNGQSASIVGNGQANCVFVDFPVLPNAGAVTVIGTVNVNITSPNPVPVVPTVNSGGSPYQVIDTPTPVTAFYNAAITGATLTTGNITPAANTNLRKLVLALTGNVALAAAGLEVITVTLNGVQIYKRQILLPNAAGTTLAQFWEDILEFSEIGLNAGAGSLVVTVGTALSSGLLEVNAYFG